MAAVRDGGVIPKDKGRTKGNDGELESRIKKTGFTTRTLPVELEKAGAAGIVGSYWSVGYGVDKIFGAYTKKIPTIDVMQEDYGMFTGWWSQVLIRRSACMWNPKSGEWCRP